MAYSHLFFNLTGIFIFYTIWPLRALPIRAAKFMGNTTAEYRWCAVRASPPYYCIGTSLLPSRFVLAYSPPHYLLTTYLRTY